LDLKLGRSCSQRRTQPGKADRPRQRPKTATLTAHPQHAMTSPPSLSRRRWLERLALAASLTPIALRSLPAALAADAPLLSATATEAQAVKYVENRSEERRGG